MAQFPFSHIRLDHESLVKEAVQLVTEISKKNPVAVAGIKHKPTPEKYSSKDGMEHMVS